MDAKKLAKSFVTSYCEGNIAGLGAVLASDFRLSGPLFRFESKSEYLDSLIGNLQADTNAEIISILGNDVEASVFFRYHNTIIGQLFKCRNGKIFETLLVFDPRGVA